MSDKGKSKTPINYEELVPGYEFSPVSYELNAHLVSKYAEAVESSSGEIVTPLAIAACAMTAIAGELSLPPGVIHASQEFEFFKLVPIGSVVNCQTKVARKITRANVQILVLELGVFDESKEKVQSGKATLVLPGQGVNAH